MRRLAVLHGDVMRPVRAPRRQNQAQNMGRYYTGGRQAGLCKRHRPGRQVRCARGSCPERGGADALHCRQRQPLHSQPRYSEPRHLYACRRMQPGPKWYAKRHGHYGALPESKASRLSWRYALCGRQQFGSPDRCANGIRKPPRPAPKLVFSRSAIIMGNIIDFPRRRSMINTGKPYISGLNSTTHLTSTQNGKGEFVPGFC